MKITQVLTVLLVVSMCYVESSWRGRRAWRRHIKRAVIRTVIAATIASAAGKRSASKLDENLDGIIDHEEIEELLNTRDVNEFLQFAGYNTDGEVSLEEFEKAVQSI